LEHQSAGRRLTTSANDPSQEGNITNAKARSVYGKLATNFNANGGSEQSWDLLRDSGPISSPHMSMTFLTTARYWRFPLDRSGRRIGLFGNRGHLRVGCFAELRLGTNLRFVILLLMVSYSFALIIDGG